MSDQFLAEIRIFGSNFAPYGWAMCDGQLLAISQNAALFSLIGTNFGGDGASTFGLPNLQGSIPIHTTQYSGNSPFGTFFLGQSGGETSVTLLSSQMPSHSHTVQADADADNATAVSPVGAVPVNATPILTFSNNASPTLAGMNPAMVLASGSSNPHNNLMPYLTLNYCIALVGIYPARS